MESSARSFSASMRRRAWAVAVVLLAATASGCGVSGIVSATPSGGCERTAGLENDWGTPQREERFDTAASLSNWHLYDGVGHAGNGIRTPEAISLSDGILTITGDASGTSGGMGWN